MKLVQTILCLFIAFQLSAQAEFQKVRQLFSKPNARIEVEVWKGFMDQVHPVEFYWARRGQALKGYYRIVSSGDEFELEGELSGKSVIVSEMDEDGQILGQIQIDKISDYTLGNTLKLKWYNSSRNDLIEFDLTAMRFADYPSGLFHPEVVKYSRFENGSKETLLIEELSRKELFLHASSSNQTNTYRIEVESLKPLIFEQTMEDGTMVKYEEVNGKLRKRQEASFQFFERENALEIQPLTFASTFFLCNVEYPETEHLAFNKWISNMIQKRRNQVRKMVNVMVQNNETPSEDHYQYKWSAWTEIDYLSDHIIAGRMVFFRSWDAEIETFSFQYDLREEAPFDILSQFKSDFNMNDYLNKFIQSELIQYNKQNSSDKYDLKLEDYTELAISDHYLIISTKFHWQYGYHKLRIPYNELVGLLKRNSILKPVMKS